MTTPLPTEPKQRNHGAGLTIALLAACVVFIAEIGYLLRVNATLNSAYVSAQEQVIRSLDLTPGAEVPAVAGVDKDGKRLSIPLRGSGRTLVVSLSSSCPACLESRPAFARLAQMARSAGIKVVFVSKDYWDKAFDMPELTAETDDVIAEPTFRTYHTLKMEKVPQTIVVSASGLVETVEVGALDEVAIDRISRVLHRSGQQ